MLTNNRRFNLLIGLIMGLSLVVVLLVVPASLNASSNTDASQRTDELNGCRAAFRAAIDTASYEVAQANKNVTRALGETQTGQTEAMVAAIQQDPTRLAIIAADLNTLEDRKVEVYADQDEAFEHLAEANAAYDDAVNLSRDDPDAFLADCNGDNP